ncbi:hypothetical protein [Paraburkholderia sp. C35]|uniref:hypothetical protein n=1 Tax=Paraburkholderia sp. C35 TaxID=2126993 RepID=UPI000D68CDB3|nr:hypothetical protein [Paraburkholderia sp. C35]
MRKIVCLLITLFVSLSFGATLTPIQLLNPTGSSSGQTVVSTGASSAPAWGGIGVNGIASIAANTVLANATGSSAGPTAFAMPSCSGTLNSLQWTSGAGFTCATPTVTGTGSVVLANQPVINGVTNGSAAAAGQVGQVLTNATAGTSLTTGTPANATSVSLTAGDWDVQCSATYIPGASTTISTLVQGVSTTSATFPAVNSGAYSQIIASFTTGQGQIAFTPVTTINVSTTTTAYCVAQAAFGVSTMTVSGFIRARRMH